MVSKNDWIKTFLLYESFSDRIFFLNPHGVRNARNPKSIRWTILSGPIHSQKLTTVGKYFPGSPINTIMNMDEMRQG